MNRAFAPIVHKPEYTRLVERELIRYLEEVLYGPLLERIRDAGVKLQPKFQAIPYDETGRENASTSAVEKALAEGRIWYADGAFSGKFSAAISRQLRDMGATKSSAGGLASFRIAQDQLHWVITDCRFENEARAVRSLGGEIWQVTRPGQAVVEGGHASQTDGSKLQPDATLVNGSDINGLRHSVLRVLQARHGGAVIGVL